MHSTFISAHNVYFFFLALLLFKSSVCLSNAVLVTAPLDIVFAISATSSKADELFQVMIDSVNALIQTFGIYKVKYALIEFANDYKVRVRFSDTYREPMDLVRRISSIPRSSGSPNIGPVLDGVKVLFEDSPRPDALRALVLIIDKRTVGDPDVAIREARTLENARIKVIPVIFGNEGDPSDVKDIAPIKNLLLVPDPDPKEVLEDLVKPLSRGMWVQKGTVLCAPVISGRTCRGNVLKRRPHRIQNREYQVSP